MHWLGEHLRREDLIDYGQEAPPTTWSPSSNEKEQAERFLHIDIACCTASRQPVGGICSLTFVFHFQSLLLDHHRPVPSFISLQSAKMVMTEFTYVFAIGTFFALLEAYNNGASTLHLPGTIHIRIFANQPPRRCRQRVGYVCVLSFRHIPASYGPLFDLRSHRCPHSRC
jgi:hypothetical protein